VVQRHRAHLDTNAFAVLVDQHDAGVGDVRSPDDLSREQFTRSSSLLGRHDRDELAAANVADDPPAGLVHPADDSTSVDATARNVDVLEHLFDGHHVQR
jgi:hypothetical protein